MEEKTVDFKTYEKARKFENFKEKVKEKWDIAKNKTVEFYYNNKEFCIFAAPIVVGLTGKIFKVAVKDRQLKAEQELKELYCYDRSLGAYWQLKRKLTQNEMLELQTRRRNGESMGMILSDMKVLKK